MHHGLASRGHEVRVFVEQPASRDVYGGMLEFSADWQAELGWLREAGDQGMVLFESVVRGEAQDALRGFGLHIAATTALPPMARLGTFCTGSPAAMCSSSTALKARASATTSAR